MDESAVFVPALSMAGAGDDLFESVDVVLGALLRYRSGREVIFHVFCLR